MDLTKNIPFVKCYNPEYTEVHTDSSDFEDLQYSFKERIKKFKRRPDLSKLKLIEDFHNQCKVEKNYQNVYRQQPRKLERCTLHVNSIEERNSDPQKVECKTVLRDDLTKKLFTNSQQKLKETQQNFISYLSSKLQKKCKKNKKRDIRYTNPTRQYESKQNATIDFGNLYAIEPVLTIDGNLYGFPKRKFHEFSVENMFSDPTLFSSYESLHQKRRDIETQTKLNKDKRHRYLKKKSRNYNDRLVYRSSSEFQSKGTGFERCNASSSWRSNELPSFTSSEINSFCAQRITRRPNEEKKCNCGLGQYRCTSPICPYSGPKQPASDCITQTQEFGTPNFPNPFPFATHPTAPTKPCCCSEKIQHFLETQQNKQLCNTVSPQEQYNQFNRKGHEHPNCTCPDPMTNMKTGDESLCQSPHNDVLTGLQNRYNRQVLCIHNPPCVLINGCLNITRPSDQELKPVLKNRHQALPRKQVYNLLGMKKKSDIDRKSDKGCQHHVPYIELNSYDRMIINQQEKLMQSKCYHSPQCDMVPKCFKPSMQTTQDMFYTHNPNCPFVAKDFKKKETVLSSWQEEPTYVNYVTNNLPLHATTQVKPKRHQNSGCYHKPPCIMVPKCLNTIIRGRSLPREVMPGCGHRPPCELVHTCDVDGSNEMMSNTVLMTKRARVPLCYQSKIFSKLRLRKL